MSDTPSTIDGLKRQDAYFLSLGRFAHTFAFVEGRLKSFMGRLSGMASSEEANAIFSGVRTKTAMSNIKRLCEARGQDLNPYYALIVWIGVE